MARYGELNDALDPLSFSGPSLSQRQQPGWEEWCITQDSVLRWIKGTSLVSGKEMWVPAQLVYKPYNYEEEPTIRLPITSGAAASLSQEETIFHGIAELVEREAFLVTYLNRLTPPRVNLKASAKSLKDLALLYPKYHLILDVYALPTDAPLAVMLAVITDSTGKGPAISVGTKTHFDPIQAVSGAVLEAHHTRIAIRQQMAKGVILPRNADEIRRPTDHAFFWIPTSRIKDLDFLNGGIEIELNHPEERINVVLALQNLKQFFKAKRFEFIWVDLTLPMFKNLGIFAGKAVAPKLHPLFIDERYPYYGGKRLYELPVELGYLKSPRTEEELNRIPNPFP